MVKVSPVRPGIRTDVVIPAFNEEQSIARVVRAIPREAVRNIIVVNNGSTDRTVEEARGAGAVVLSEPRKGYGHACLAGIDHAMREGADIIVFLDGDFSDYPEELPSLLMPITHGNADMVIGSRMNGMREQGAMLPQAVFGNWLATFLIKLFWNYRYTDLGPFRAVKVSALRRMNMCDPTYGWTVEMQVKAAKLGLQCAEVPVRYRRRIGTSKVTGTISGTINASIKILYIIFKYLFVRA